MFKDILPAVYTIVVNWKASDYPNRLVHLQLESLELRRLYNDITMVYKIVHKLTSLNDDVLLSYHNANNNYHVLTRGHTLKGAIQVLRNADGGGGVSDFLEKSVTKV